MNHFASFDWLRFALGVFLFGFILKKQTLISAQQKMSLGSSTGQPACPKARMQVQDAPHAMLKCSHLLLLINKRRWGERRGGEGSGTKVEPAAAAAAAAKPSPRYMSCCRIGSS